MNHTAYSSLFVLGLAGCVGLGSSDQEVGGGGGSGGSQSSPPSAQARGAIFTTTIDGDRVNANIFAAKGDVYLDGGPGENAGSHSAALAEGEYYFQVTSPSGKDLLSTDDIECRRFYVNAFGVIDTIVPGPGCQHASGVDADYAALGAITIQLAPYLDTTNNGGEYKVWVTTVSAYSPSETKTHGFVHSASKTDNFKIRETETEEPPPPPEEPPPPPEEPPPPPEEPPPVPCCGDGHVDSGEQCDDGNLTDGDGCSAICTIEPPPPPEPCCGDGHVDAGEQCDDGNTTSGDGCSATCGFELDVGDHSLASTMMSR